MTRSWLPALFLMLAVLSPLPARAAGDIRVAVVDVHRATQQTKHWKAAADSLEKERATRQAQLEAKQRELRERKEQLDAQRAVSDPKASVAAEEQLMKEAQMLTQSFMQSQQALTRREQQLTGQMLQRIELLVRELSLKNDYTFVFERGAADAPNVLYADKRVDVTDQVLALYRKRYKGKPLDLKPKAQN